jgi:uncharacterized protein YbcV (DUF1398 family)
MWHINIMTKANMLLGQGYQATIDLITEQQASIAAAGSKVVVITADSDNKQLLAQKELRTALGDTAYNTLVANTLTALNTALTTAKTTATNALAAL